MVHHREPNSNHILSSALKWVMGERLFLRLAMEVSEHNLDDELQAEYPKMFDASDPVTAEFLVAYEKCFDFHMGGYVLRAEEFLQMVTHTQECYLRVQNNSGFTSISSSND